MAERMANTTTHDQPADDSSFDLNEISTDKRRPGPGVMRKFMGKSALAAMSMIGPVDYMTSDAKDGAYYGAIGETIDLDSEAAERLLENGTFFVLGVGEITLLGTLISKSKKARGAFDAFDAYKENQDEEWGEAIGVKEKVKRVAEHPLLTLNRIFDIPFAVLERIGNKVEAKREELENQEEVKLRKAKLVALDTAVFNVMGTSTAQLQETMAGNPPSLKRNLYIGTLFSASWIAGAEAIRTAYRKLPLIRPPMAFFGEAFNTATSPTNPVGAATLGTVAASLAYIGWRVESFRQKQAGENDGEGEL